MYGLLSASRRVCSDHQIFSITRDMNKIPLFITTLIFQFAFHLPAQDLKLWYDTPATLDTVAGRALADWVLNLGKTTEEE